MKIDFFLLHKCMSVVDLMMMMRSNLFLAKSCLIFGLHNTVLTMDAVRGKTHYWGGKIKIFQKKILFSCFVIKYTLFLFHNNPFHIVI